MMSRTEREMNLIIKGRRQSVSSFIWKDSPGTASGIALCDTKETNNNLILGYALQRQWREVTWRSSSQRIHKVQQSTHMGQRASSAERRYTHYAVKDGCHISISFTDQGREREIHKNVPKTLAAGFMRYRECMVFGFRRRTRWSRQGYYNIVLILSKREGIIKSVSVPARKPTVNTTRKGNEGIRFRNYAKGCEQEYDVKHHIDAVKQTVTQEQNFKKPSTILMVIITDDSINLMS